MARVLLARTARDALAALDLLDAGAVSDALVELERDPHFGHELRGTAHESEVLPGRGLRIIYEFRDDRTVRAIRHRGSAYDDTDPR